MTLDSLNMNIFWDSMIISMEEVSNGFIKQRQRVKSEDYRVDLLRENASNPFKDYYRQVACYWFK